MNTGDVLVRVHFIRHGQSEANRDRVFANRGDGPGLTGLGRQQAAVLAEGLVGELAGDAVHEICSSPLLRARQTAAILADAVGAPVTVTEALREYDVGRWEGTPTDEHEREYWNTERAWLAGRSDARTGGGESQRELRDRFRPLIDRVLAGPAGRTWVLVGHGGLFRAVLPGVLDGVTARFAFRHALPETGRVVATVHAGRLRCDCWAGLGLP
jgi:probable phosphoglycerate mutase